MEDMEDMEDKGGRPKLYKPEYNEQARKLCLLGSTDKDLADFFEVCEATINNWKIEHEGFLESIKRGKDLADSKVAESLYHRAMGYKTKEVKIATEHGKITDTREVDKYYPPDATSIIFWLKNRQSKKWRDKQDVQHTTINREGEEATINYSSLSTEVLQAIVEATTNKS